MGFSVGPPKPAKGWKHPRRKGGAAKHSHRPGVALGPDTRQGRVRYGGARPVRNGPNDQTGNAIILGNPCNDMAFHINGHGVGRFKKTFLFSRRLDNPVASGNVAKQRNKHARHPATKPVPPCKVDVKGWLARNLNGRCKDQASRGKPWRQTARNAKAYQGARARFDQLNGPCPCPARIGTATENQRAVRLRQHLGCRIDHRTFRAKAGNKAKPRHMPHRTAGELPRKRLR